LRSKLLFLKRRMTLSRRIAAETLGTAFLLTAVVGSGIMGEKLAGGNVAIALLANTLATGAMLVTLIFTFGPISGAHFNPAVTLADASQSGIGWSDVPAYILGQAVGAFIGLGAAHLMFGEALLQVSQHARTGPRSSSVNLSQPSGCCVSFGAVLVCVPKQSPLPSVFTSPAPTGLRLPRRLRIRR
jgi:glycerol uptake facilitator-like aquaporin